MTSKKDFKTLVRERMIKTRESYTVARMHVLREHGEGVYVDTTVYTLAVDGRWCATDPAYPGCIGYGPTKYHAGRDVSRMAFALPLSRPRSVLNVLTLIEMSPSRWTARATEQLDVCVEASSREDAVRDLLGALGSRHERRSWACSDDDEFERVVVFQKRPTGAWSAKTLHVTGEGATLNDAEADLIDAEDAFYDMPDMDHQGFTE